MYVLGISAFYHDSAAALVCDGRIVAAAQEERFSRRRHDAGFPTRSIRYCLDAGGIDASDLDRVVFYEKPFIKFERLLETYLAFAPRGFDSFRHALPSWLGGKLFLKNALIRALRDFDRKLDWAGRLQFAEHHQSHAASAFYPSPFEEAAILTMDGVGEWTTTSLASGHGNQIEISHELHFPHSLGLLYSAVTYHLGFRVNSGEYKVMGLAPYGEPSFAAAMFEQLIDVKPDGSFRLNQRFFGYCTGLVMTAPLFDTLAGGPPRRPETPLLRRHLDLAASVQHVVEEVVLRLTRHVAATTGARNLCLAGGVALNCVANGKILRDRQFDRIWIQPASGDAGGALGAALTGYYGDKVSLRRFVSDEDTMQGALLGPDFDQDDIEARLLAIGATFDVLPEAALVERVATDLALGHAVGWMQGRMEFGPRALGARSILADPRDASMQRKLNLKIKHRESFRPFAPAVLLEDAGEWFDLLEPSAYMLLTHQVHPSRRCPPRPQDQNLVGLGRLDAMRSSIPAVTHVDGSARVQTVDRQTSPRFHALLTAFKALTGCPVLVNTSFNLRGEPIVCTPEDAFRCFMATDLDVLTIGDCYLTKPLQSPALVRGYLADLPPD